MRKRVSAFFPVIALMLIAGFGEQNHRNNGESIINSSSLPTSNEKTVIYMDREFFNKSK